LDQGERQWCRADGEELRGLRDQAIYIGGRGVRRFFGVSLRPWAPRQVCSVEMPMCITKMSLNIEDVENTDVMIERDENLKLMLPGYPIVGRLHQGILTEGLPAHYRVVKYVQTSH
jgi:hypothetical protein